MKEFEKELGCYQRLNRISRRGSVVLFGSSFAKDIPVSELTQTFGLDCVVYNRSFGDLSVADAAGLIDEAVMGIEPKKIIIQLGETDLERGYKTVDEIISSYRELIAAIRKKDKHVKIVTVSVISDEKETAAFNSALEALASETGCRYADITTADDAEERYVKAFGKLKFFMIDRITFFDAMNYAGI